MLNNVIQKNNPPSLLLAHKLFLLVCLTLLTSCGSGSSSSGGAAAVVSGSGALFRVEGANAFMSGDITSSIGSELAQLIQNNPGVTNIVMTNVPGSSDDEVAIPAYSMIRDSGLSTEVRSNGLIASGGVDMFVAGTSRVIQSGAQIGVHAWIRGSTSATSLPRDHPDHRLYIDYYIRMGLPDPEGFYFFTINAAPPEGIHYMTEAEINRYGLRN